MLLAGLVQYNWSRSVGLKTSRWKVETEADPAANMRKEFVRLKQMWVVLVSLNSAVVHSARLKVRGNRAGCAGFGKSVFEKPSHKCEFQSHQGPVTQMMCWRRESIWCRWTMSSG
jgi:hypothetical protein